MRSCFIMRFFTPHAVQYVTKAIIPFLLDVPSRVKTNGFPEKGLHDILKFRPCLKEDTVGMEDQTAPSH